MQPEGVVFDLPATPRGDSDAQELARMADALVEQLAETRRHYEQLRSELGAVAGDAAAPPEVAPRETEPELAPEPERETEPELEHEEQYEAADDEVPADDGVRLFALTLALNGATREDVSEQLRDQFGVDDTGGVLDSVFPPTAPTRATKRRFNRRRRGS